MTSTYKLGQTPGAVIETDDEGQVHMFAAWDPESGEPPSQRQGIYAAWLADGHTPAAADPPPLVYAAVAGIDARLRTTDATATELYRATLRQLTGYTALLSLVGVDAGNGALRMIRASVVAKRLSGGALLVGAPVVIANHADAAAATWAIGASVSGNDFVVTVSGAAGRSIDWRLSGTIESFTPGGA